MLALDRPTKSIVVAIRGTVSVADLATDMLADPEPMEEWLPDTMSQVHHHHEYRETLYKQSAWPAVPPAYLMLRGVMLVSSPAAGSEWNAFKTRQHNPLLTV